MDWWIADNNDWRGTDEGAKLKESGTWHWESPNTGATNESGFTALPGGYRHHDDSYTSRGYSGKGFYAYFWSTTESNDFYAWQRHLGHTRSKINRYDYHKGDGFSVRCIKD